MESSREPSEEVKGSSVTPGNTVPGETKSAPASVVDGQKPQKKTKSRSSRRRSGRGGGGSDQNRPNSLHANSPLSKVQVSFFGCHRCSYFFSSLRVLLTLEGVDETAQAISKGWLSTPWSQQLCENIERCYGVEIHADTTHFQGTCLECGRNFVISGDEESATLNLLEIQSERLAPYPR